MDTLRNFIERFKDSPLPAGVLAVSAIVLLFVTFKVNRSVLKGLSLIVALAASSGDVGWLLSKK